MSKKLKTLLEKLIDCADSVRFNKAYVEVSMGRESMIFNTGTHNTLEEALNDALNALDEFHKYDD